MIPESLIHMRLIRILHLVAVGVALSSMGAAALTWLDFHKIGDTSSRELANLGGLVAGVILGGVLLWGSVRSAAWDARTTITLYLCWIGIFGWYWFNRFGASEVHSFDPRQVEVERMRQALTSGAFFLLWLILFSIGPAFSAVLRKKTGRR
jgi:hypothetical protein